MSDNRPIVLAYSGGLDTSVILVWLKERYQRDVIAFSADLGQGEDLVEIARKARELGAREVIVQDLKETFVRDYIFPMLRAEAVYEGEYMLGTSIARPLIARAQVETARRYNAWALAHGATGKGNDQVRFELAYSALAPDLVIIAPWREWEFEGRSDLIAYAEKKGIPVPATREKPYSVDQNLWHVSYEGGILEDPSLPPPEEIFLLTRSPFSAPDQPEEVEIEFEEGNPVALQGRHLSPDELLKELNMIAGRHGIGRVDIVENRYVGIKSRGVYETPGGTLLYRGFRAIASLTMDREVQHLRAQLMPRYAELIYYGYWYSPEREALQQFFDFTARVVTGKVRFQLYKGNAVLLSRSSPRSLYRPDLSTFEKGSGFRQGDATGFLRILGIRLKPWGEFRNRP
jgi:argininosuccinate synthase